MWKVRSTKNLDQQINQLAIRRGVSKSEIIRQAAAAYIRAS